MESVLSKQMERGGEAVGGGWRDRHRGSQNTQGLELAGLGKGLAQQMAARQQASCMAAAGGERVCVTCHRPEMERRMAATAPVVAVPTGVAGGLGSCWAAASSFYRPSSRGGGSGGSGRGRHLDCADGAGGVCRRSPGGALHPGPAAVGHAAAAGTASIAAGCR